MAKGTASSNAPTPRWESSSNPMKPAWMPSMWLVLLRTPKRAPDRISRKLLGPGVMDATSANSASGPTARFSGMRGPASLAHLRGQFLRLELGLQRREQFVERAVHHVRQLVQREVDAVVGDATLREVVGPD